MDKVNVRFDSGGEFIRTLMLVDYLDNCPNTIHDHISAITSMPGFSVTLFSPVHQREALPFSLDSFDVIIIHYSICIYMDDYVPELWRRALTKHTGLKVLFIQDEYRFIFSVLDSAIELGIDVLFTCVPEDRIDMIYGPLRKRGVRLVPTLTGYVPDYLIGRERLPMSERSRDVVYRGRDVPWELGRLALEKTYIAEKFNQITHSYFLKTDVSSRDEHRIYGNDWIKLLSSGKTSLLTESGASICDFTGEIRSAVLRYMSKYPNSSYRDVERDILCEFEGNIVINTISPRAFEAISLGTVLVAFPGSYSGVIKRDRHYIPLEKDFSNISDVVEKIRDDEFLQNMADRTYEEIILSGKYSYELFSRETADIIREEWIARCHRVFVPSPRWPGRPEKESVKCENAEQWKASLAEQIEHHYRLETSVNVAQASQGATIGGSSPFFPRPNDADYLLRRIEAGGYAAALPDTPLPHWIQIDLDREYVLSYIEIEWFDSQNFPENFEIYGAGNDSVYINFIKENNNESHKLFYDIPNLLTQHLKIVAHSFVGQNRMLIKRFNAWSRKE